MQMDDLRVVNIKTDHRKPLVSIRQYKGKTYVAESDNADN